MPDEVNRFRAVVALSGLLIALLILFGVFCLIRSKWLSWQQYKCFFGGARATDLPGPLRGESLPWGVDTPNTKLTMVPEAVLPIVFILAWGFLFFSQVL